MRGGGRRVQRVGVGQLLLLGQQGRVLAGHRRGRLDLGQAEPQRLRLGRALPLGPRQRLELLADRAVPVVHPPVVGQGRRPAPARRTGPARPAAGPGLSSCCWSACPCTATRSSASTWSSDTGTECPPANARDRPSADTERLSTSEDPLSSRSPPAFLDLARHFRGDQQPPLHRGPRRARPHPRRVGPAAEQQPERRHDHGLPGAGLAGQRGEPGRKLEHRVVDDAEAGDPDFLKHARLRPPRYGRASPPRAGRTWPPAGP